MVDILVTGSSGYLGRVVCSKLRYAKHHVIPYDNSIYLGTSISGDIRDREEFEYHANKADAIIHLAGVVGDAACEYDREYTQQTNVAATRYLAEFTNQRVVFASSCSVYGYQEEIVDEESPLNPISYYAETKIESEKILRDHPDCVVLRFPTMFGVSPRMRYDLVVNTFVRDAVNKREITVHGGNQSRPFCSVSDVASAVIKMTVSGHTGVYNVGGYNYTLAEVASLIKETFPYCSVNIDKEVQDARSYRVSFEKIEHTIGKVAKQTINGCAAKIVGAMNGSEYEPRFYNALAIKEGRL